MNVTQSKGYIQVGFTALRDPATGAFLPAVPLFIREDDSAAAAERKMTEDIGALLARRMKAYRDGCLEAGVSV